MDILNKSWEDPLAATKKFLAREIMYRLSKQVEPTNFEVVLDGDLDLFNKTDDQPDIAIYARKSNFAPVIGVVLSTKARFSETSKKATSQFNLYGLKEFLIYSIDEDRWYSISEKNQIFGITNNSEILKISLGSYNLVHA